MNPLLRFAAVIVVSAMIFARGVDKTGVTAPAPTASASHHFDSWAPGAPEKAPHEAFSIQRGADGAFAFDVGINGQSARFIVDTGASVTALSEAEAQRLGVSFDPAEFQPMVQTASGVGQGQRVHIDRMVIGDQELTGVDAVVIRGLGTNLLGQTVLARLGKVELTGDSMVIRPG